MWFHKIDSATGKILAKVRLNGQSFRMLHPVLHAGLLFVQTVQPICVGSEYVMEGVMRDSSDIATEQRNILRWLSGDTNEGQWRDASSAWKHLFVLRTQNLTEPFVVPNGPADGCGSPAPPPTVDGDGRVLAWFKTAHPTLTAKGSFGTRYSMDISAIDLKTGLRAPIDNGHLSGTTGETDNLFALSSGGSLLYLRQRFRGTKLIDLHQSTSHLIQAAIRTRDGGTWPADVVYRDREGLPRASQPALAGREAVVIAGDKLLFAEEYAVTLCRTRSRKRKVRKLLKSAVLAGAMLVASSEISRGQTTPVPVGQWDKYLWETCRTSDIPPAASNLVAELDREVQKILDAGPLAPLRTVYADLEQDPYFMYWQGGRIINTLAMAWPFLTTLQQEAVQGYVRRELDDDQRSPWTSKGFIPPESGARRELHTFHEARGWDRYWQMWGNKKPTAGAFYGLWLYADRSGDWETIQQHYSQIKDVYLRRSGQCGLYGTMGGEHRPGTHRPALCRSSHDGPGGEQRRSRVSGRDELRHGRDGRAEVLEGALRTQTTWRGLPGLDVPRSLPGGRTLSFDSR